MNEYESLLFLCVIMFIIGMSLITYMIIESIVNYYANKRYAKRYIIFQRLCNVMREKYDEKQ